MANVDSPKGQGDGVAKRRMESGPSPSTNVDSPKGEGDGVAKRRTESGPSPSTNVDSPKGKGDGVAKRRTESGPSPSTADVNAQDTSGYETETQSAQDLEVNITTRMHAHAHQI